MTDLTGGLGVDCSFLARNFRKVDYVERQEVLCELARHNFPLLGLPQVTVHCADGVEYLQKMEPVDCLFWTLPVATVREEKQWPLPTANPMCRNWNRC